jgi:hypothetical protein
MHTDAKSSMKLVISILDLLVRVAASITACAGLLLAFFIGGMMGIPGLIAFAIPALGLGGWIVLCAVNPTKWSGNRLAGCEAG